jgi:hypothetical protein
MSVTYILVKEGNRFPKSKISRMRLFLPNKGKRFPYE